MQEVNQSIKPRAGAVKRQNVSTIGKILFSIGNSPTISRAGSCPVVGKPSSDSSPALLSLGTFCQIAVNHRRKTTKGRRAIIIGRTRGENTIYQIITVYMVIMLRNDSISNAGSVRLTLFTRNANGLTNIIIRISVSIKTASSQSLTQEAGRRITAAAFDGSADSLHSFT